MVSCKCFKYGLFTCSKDFKYGLFTCSKEKVMSGIPVYQSIHLGFYVTFVLRSVTHNYLILKVFKNCESPLISFLLIMVLRALFFQGSPMLGMIGSSWSLSVKSLSLSLFLLFLPLNVLLDLFLATFL